MKHILNEIAKITTTISEIVWPIFLPILIIMSLFISFVAIYHIRKTIKNKQKLRFKEMIGPASISLGAKIGTGSIIGVLGSLNKLSGSGQSFIEGFVLWAFFGALILIPLTYSETLIARVKDMSPIMYIKENISVKASLFYSIALVTLYAFGFGGFQFNGIDTVASIAYTNLTGNVLVEMQRYLFVIIPIITITAIIILSKKHTVFINALSSMIGFAVLLYFIFFSLFVINTSSYIPVFVQNALKGMANPIVVGIGIPTGFIFGLQRIIQTSEAGLGTSPLASEEGKEVGPRIAAITQVIPTAITVAVSTLITSYITSYGISVDIIELPSDGITRLVAFFDTAGSVTGMFGTISISIFATLSGITTMLGGYFFLTQIFKNNSENKNIAIYLILISTAGTLAVFGFDIIFDVVDILLFAVAGINVLALGIICIKYLKTKNLTINK